MSRPRFGLDWNKTHPVYTAEKAALPWGIPFRDLDHVVDYVTELLSDEWWVERYPRVAHAWIHTSNNQSWAATLGRHLYLPDFAMWEGYVLHELSHVVAKPDTDDGHGAHFRETEIDLIRHKMGDWPADNLKLWFNKMGCS